MGDRAVVDVPLVALERELPSWIGIGVAVAGNLLISIALNLQKYAHAHGPTDGTDAEPLYTKSKIWWLGVGLMLLGETGNFLAYGFAPASVIAPLGTVALISNAIIAPTFLGEKFRPRDFVGIAMAVAGTITIVTHSKSSEVQLDAAAFIAAITTMRFCIYAICISSLLFLLYTIYPKYHHRTVFVDLGLVAIYGGFTVLSTKAISTLLGGSWFLVLTMPIFYPLLVIMIGTGILQIRYLNNALRQFDSTVVIPTQFVLFTISAIAGSSVLYNDFDQQEAHTIIIFLFGCLMTFAAVFLIGSERNIPAAPSLEIKAAEEALLAHASVVFHGSEDDEATGTDLEPTRQPDAARSRVVTPNPPRSPNMGAQRPSSAQWYYDPFWVPHPPVPRSSSGHTVATSTTSRLPSIPSSPPQGLGAASMRLPREPRTPRTPLLAPMLPPSGFASVPPPTILDHGPAVLYRPADGSTLHYYLPSVAARLPLATHSAGIHAPYYPLNSHQASVGNSFGSTPRIGYMAAYARPASDDDVP